MINSNSPNSELLKSVLEPLLEDFQYWFGRSRHLLETAELTFLEPEKHEELLDRVITAQQEVSTTQLLFKLTGEQVGVEPSVLTPWHQLVHECWQVAMRFHQEESAKKGM